jgi:hypothetical protein
MNSKEVLKEIRTLLGFSEDKKVAMETATLVDGTVIEWEGSLAVGTSIFVQTGEGLIAAPDATHELSNGTLVTTEGGIVMEVVEGQEIEMEEVAEIVEEVEEDLVESIAETIDEATPESVSEVMAEEIAESVVAAVIEVMDESGVEVVIKAMKKGKYDATNIIEEVIEAEDIVDVIADVVNELTPDEVTAVGSIAEAIVQDILEAVEESGVEAVVELMKKRKSGMYALIKRTKALEKKFSKMEKAINSQKFALKRTVDLVEKVANLPADEPIKAPSNLSIKEQRFANIVKIAQQLKNK